MAVLVAYLLDQVISIPPSTSVASMTFVKVL